MGAYKWVIVERHEELMVRSRPKGLDHYMRVPVKRAILVHIPSKAVAERQAKKKVEANDNIRAEHPDEPGRRSTKGKAGRKRTGQVPGSG